MVKKPLFKLFLFLLIAAALLHILAAQFYIYWTVSWFDMVVHFTAGASVGVASVLLLENFYKNTQTRRIIFTSLLLVLIVGILWEIFELLIGSTFLSDGWAYVFDTASDLSMDIFGGFLGITYAIYISRRHNG